MDNIYICCYKSEVGELILGDFNGKLCLCDWRYRKMRTVIDSKIKKYLNAEYLEQKTALHTLAIKQLEEYFNKKRKIFELPLLFVGTDFQKQIWNLLLELPFGSTSTYMNQALKIEKLGAIRAVASANGANAISIIVPCHRIIGSNGEMVGYAGGVSVKKKLLQLEGVVFENQNQIEINF